jgi:hypothetical protein
VVAGNVSAQTETVSTRIGDFEYEAGCPTKATSEKLYDEMDFQRATQAYMWAFPLVSSASIRRGLFDDRGASYYDILVYQKFLDTKSIWFTGNNTTIYGAALFDMAKDGPVVHWSLLRDSPAGRVSTCTRKILRKVAFTSTKMRMG